MKKIIALVVLLAALVGGWYYASPLLALDGLRAAAEAGNEAELEERVDFPAVRTSLKEQLRTALTEAAQDQSGSNPLGAAGAALGLGFIDPIVDNTVTPEWVAKMLVEGQRRQAQIDAARQALPVREPAGPDTPGTPGPRSSEKRDAAPQGEPEFAIERQGFNNFRVTTESPAGGSDIILLFERDGLGWNLVGVEMPASDLIPGR